MIEIVENKYDRKLKDAMAEIKAILLKNDIAGVIALHTVEDDFHLENGKKILEGYAEYMMHITTTYSAGSIDQDSFHLKAKLEHYPTQHEKELKVAGAENQLENLARVVGQMAMNLIDLSEKVKNDLDTLKKKK